jgi:Domain of unknown function (DUF4157)
MEHVKPSHDAKSDSARTAVAVEPATAKERPSGYHAILALQRSVGNQAVGEMLQVLAGPGQPLGAATRDVMGERFGTDFSDVRTHNDAQANASARAVGAVAYTSGQHIVFGPGAFSLNERRSGALLAHELAHVVQQSRGGDATVAGSADTSLEAEAESAAKGFLQGVSQIPIHGSAAPGLARAPKMPEDEDEKKRASQATMTAVTQRPKVVKPLESPVHVVSNKDKGRKAKGVLGEAGVPLERYAGPDWNVFGGGSETASSRANLARQSSHDKRAGREGTAGFDFLAQNVKTDLLVIGEQKATKGNEFTKTTAITTSLESNLAHTVKVLQKQIDSGAVKEPTEIARLQKTIERLQATEAAVKNRQELPEGVVFELTNVRGEGKQIGKQHLDLLAKKYGKNPAFVEHLLSRTFVRDPELAKSRVRDPGGEHGPAVDPDAVPAKDILTKDAKEVLERLHAGKTVKQWKAEKAKQKIDNERAQPKEPKVTLKVAKAKARQVGEQARQERLKQLKEAQKNEPQERTKKLRDKAANKLKAEAREAGKQAEKTEFDKLLTQRKQEAEAQTARRADEKAQKDVRTQERDANRQTKELETQQAEQKDAKLRKADTHGTKTPEEIAGMYEKAKQEHEAWAARMNDKARSDHTAAKRDAGLSKAAHVANQAAAGLRAYDAYDDAIAKGKGSVEASLDAAKTYLENTNPALGALSTVEQRMQKDASGKQYYGDDAVDAWLGTLGETGAGYLVPGAGWDQAVNAAANVGGAVDDHLKKGRDPNDPENDKANLRTVGDLAADLTPSRMAAQALGGGARAYYDIARAATGDTKGVDKFGEDAVHGKLGAVIQPWAMAADFVGNLGSDSAGVALDKTIKKTEGTTLKKVGDASGDAMYNLGQSKVAKSGKYGAPVQGISMILGMTSDHIAGKSFEKSLNEAAEAGKGTIADTVGSALGDAAFATVQTGKKIINEDLPAAKKIAVEAIEQQKQLITDWWNKL